MPVFHGTACEFQTVFAAVDVEIGDKISIKGFGSRSDSTRVNPKSVLSADGRALFTGPGDDGYDQNAAR